MAGKRITVVIRSFNEERYIGRLLEAISRQTVRDEVEILVVDSGSTDRTLSIASEYADKVLSIRPEEFSFGRSLNRGCESARGEFIVIASAHVFPLKKDWIERLIAPFSDPQVALVYGRQQGGERSRYSEHQVLSQWFREASNLNQDQPFCNNANAVIRRSAWERQSYDETLTGLEDLAWAQRAMQSGSRIAYVADAPVIHSHNESAMGIYNRYRREAIAMKHIFPQESFSPWDFFHLLLSNVVSDGYHAWHDGVLMKNLLDISVFRTMQFWGTYRGFSQRGPVGQKLRRQFYYPHHRNHPVSWGISSDSEGVKGDSPDVSAPMSTEIIDVSVGLKAGIPIWPGSTGFKLDKIKRLEDGDSSNVSQLNCDVHVGTHVDAPAHFLKDGKTIEKVPLDILIGPAVVVSLPQVKSISAQDLEQLDLPKGTQRLLIRTQNSKLWENSDGRFRDDFVGLTREAAQWVVDHKIRLIGIDYLSIQRYQDDPRTHEILLDVETVILEGLDLSDVLPGRYELICLPIRLEGAEGAPARVVLRHMEGAGHKR